MTKTTLIISLLLLSVSACTITPTETETEPNDTDNQTEPCNQPEPEPTYQTCPEVSVCDSVASDCDTIYLELCGGTWRGAFTCGDVAGYFFSDGSTFIFDGSVSDSSVSNASRDYCGSLS